MGGLGLPIRLLAVALLFVTSMGFIVRGARWFAGPEETGPLPVWVVAIVAAIFLGISVAVVFVVPTLSH
jgi:hypothetical protein